MIYLLAVKLQKTLEVLWLDVTQQSVIKVSLVTVTLLNNRRNQWLQNLLYFSKVVLQDVSDECQEFGSSLP